MLNWLFLPGHDLHRDQQRNRRPGRHTDGKWVAVMNGCARDVRRDRDDRTEPEREPGPPAGGAPLSLVLGHRQRGDDEQPSTLGGSVDASRLGW